MYTSEAVTAAGGSVLLGFGRVVLRLGRVPQQKGNTERRQRHHRKRRPVQLDERGKVGMNIMMVSYFDKNVQDVVNRLQGNLVKMCGRTGLFR